MAERTRSPQHPVVSVGFDGTELGMRAVRWTTAFARRTDASVSIVSVWKSENAPPRRSRLWPTAVRTSEPSADTPFLEALVVSDPPDRALVEESTRCDLLVVGVHASDRVGHLLAARGGTGRSVARSAACPVVLVTEKCADEPHRCVVVWTGAHGDDEDELLRWTIGFAAQASLPVHVLVPCHTSLLTTWPGADHARDEARARAHLQQNRAATFLRAHAGPTRWTTSVIEASVGQVVLRHTYDHDLVVVSREDDGPLESVLENARGAVVAVPMTG